MGVKFSKLASVKVAVQSSTAYFHLTQEIKKEINLMRNNMVEYVEDYARGVWFISKRIFNANNFIQDEFNFSLPVSMQLPYYERVRDLMVECIKPVIKKKTKLNTTNALRLISRMRNGIHDLLCYDFGAKL